MRTATSTSAPAGTAHRVLGTLWAPDAAALDRRLNQLTATVCRQDPRTNRQQRADAMAVLAAGASAMTCGCESADCPARANSAEPGQIVIHVMAQAATVPGASEAAGYLPGHGAIPAGQIREFSKRALLRPVPNRDELGAEPRYRPRPHFRRFRQGPGSGPLIPRLGRPAEVCDIDHTIPYGQGRAHHPSNPPPLCRPHHLVKTFLCGENGWREEQATAPSSGPPCRDGPTPRPRVALFFPELAEPTGPVTVTAHRIDGESRTLMMPTRRRTRLLSGWPASSGGARHQRGTNERGPATVLARRG